MLLIGKTHLLCHDLPGLYQSLVMFGCLLNIIILSCYHLTPSMIYLTLWLSCLRESCLVIVELSATPHSVGATSRIHPPQNKVPHGTKCHTTRWGPPLESVGATSWICRAIPVMSSYSRNLIILLINCKKDNLYGVWEEVMDAGMIPCL